MPAVRAPTTARLLCPRRRISPTTRRRPLPPSPNSRIPKERRNFSLKVDVPEVTVDVGVLLEKTHTFVPGLKPSNFRVYEDGVEQKITGFKRVEAPITALLLCEFASTSYYFI